MFLRKLTFTLFPGLGLAIVVVHILAYYKWRVYKIYFL